MNKFLTKLIILFFLLTNQTISEENIMILKLKDGDVKIELFEDVAPKHVKRIKELQCYVSVPIGLDIDYHKEKEDKNHKSI